MTPWPAISGALHRLRGVAGHGWSWLRQVSGDAAYENYLGSIRRLGLCPSGASPAPKPLSAEEFYLDALRRHYSSINRCC